MSKENKNPNTRLNALFARQDELKSLDKSYISQLNEKIKMLANFQHEHNNGCLKGYTEYVKTFKDEADYFDSQKHLVINELQAPLKTYCDEFNNIHAYLSRLKNSNTTDTNPSHEKLNRLKQLKSELAQLVITHQNNTVVVKEASSLINNLNEFFNSDQTDIFLSERKDIEKMRDILKQDVVGYKQFKDDMERECHTLNTEINELIAPPPGSKKNSSFSGISSTTLPYIAPQWHNNKSSKSQLVKDTEELMSQMRAAFEQGVKSIKIPRKSHI